jgi:hypothetical protein
VTRPAKPLAGPLLDAFLAVLEVEAGEQDAGKRMRILRTTRSTLDALNDGHLTTEEAIKVLLALRPTPEST